MTTDWAPLRSELQVWREAGLTLPLWWRDDDAIAPSRQLDRLVGLSSRTGLPVHLAIIPRDASQGLVDQVAEQPSLVPVVHGWAHQNHAPKGEKKSEFRLHRPLASIVSDARNGFLRLQESFGDRLCPMFVPPWNRIAPEVTAELAEIGYQFLSTATPRTHVEAAPGLTQVNTHLDPIDWRGTRGLADPNALIAKTVSMLQDRREGRADPTEPFGVLTHHLVHDQQIWGFTEALLDCLMAGPTRVRSAGPH
ncbi:polysaccharide deacetylase family protein [Ruegeria arenilitoris]|uniref:polysaccharide deacetylase family protein n=1 Tax=Ruegeria arenilitoris TaxID=1173585 RepID=UPI00147E26CF|nr:polysaccharide deacetylase family protein [Ruegeria arenilitoris]